MTNDLVIRSSAAKWRILPLEGLLSRLRQFLARAEHPLLISSDALMGMQTLEDELRG
jgi:hypothetical protein